MNIKQSEIQNMTGEYGKNNMKEITKALLKSQKEFPLIKKEDSNPFFKSKYAGLPSVLEVILPILNKNELVIIQSPISENERVGVETIIYHSSGEFVTSKFTMNLSKNDPQGAGSAITYARRYALVSMLGLNVDEDDDANTASNLKPIKKLTGNNNQEEGEPFI